MSPLATAGRTCNPAIAELAQTDLWVCWRYHHRADRPNKPAKKPFTPGGSEAKTTDPRTWSSFDECWRAAFVEGRFDGIGRVLTARCPYVAFDIDECCALDGAVAPRANEVLRAFPSYTEVTPSGAGLHVWVRGYWPVNKSGKPFEVLAARHFVTVTGNHLTGTPDTITGFDLAPLWREQFEKRHLATIAATSPSTPSIIDSLPEPLPEAELAHLIRLYPQFRATIQGSYPSLSERDPALARRAKNAGKPPQWAAALIRAARRCDDHANSLDYLNRTLSQVY